MASTSARPKGVRPPGGGFFHAATRCSCSDRRPRISAAGSLRSPHRLPALSGGFAAVQKLIPPAGQGRGGYPQFAREGFQILAAQQPQDRCRLAFGRPASPPVAPLFGSPSGRPTGSLRGPRSWFSLFAHSHLHVISHPFSPQFGVQENPRAREPEFGLLVGRMLSAFLDPLSPVTCCFIKHLFKLLR